ncbi:type III secretion system major needle protein, YscF/MxiH/PrgI family [Variovorax sp. OK605]|jgi:type III secretion protein I|uniref:type III secretion system inner rod subunit SctI n=1 Tax=unclassified Variovorax TaxID=663243 RepID=UPI0008AE12DA|nr:MULTISPECIES: type III secretion system inner rod subunit SctI [unclassified Variovorax]SEK10097.1 type III secretion system major needle protein, YscF/MxiH/PrgI family [Variovorax sp. OK202]SFD66393.1 type III secretion system major needle protein, YscF/MxiH/PrgI family [Variovorax sp. OK212]SFQ12657.1 type III secretion system major needle protein, YscF/MxiH/PrgI family [Variovorax sp. OK605]
MDIIATPVTAAALAAPAPAVVHTPAAPDSLAAQRFAEIMNATPPADAGAVLRSGPVAEPLPVGPVAGTQASMGERILSGMQGVSSDFQNAWKSVSATLNSEQPLAMQDLLKMQMNLTQISVQYELVGKAISRSTQNFDQLVRVQ